VTGKKLRDKAALPPCGRAKGTVFTVKTSVLCKRNRVSGYQKKRKNMPGDVTDETGHGKQGVPLNLHERKGGRPPERVTKGELPKLPIIRECMLWIQVQSGGAKLGILTWTC